MTRPLAVIDAVGHFAGRAFGLVVVPAVMQTGQAPLGAFSAPCLTPSPQRPRPPHTPASFSTPTTQAPDHAHDYHHVSDLTMSAPPVLIAARTVYRPDPDSNSCALRAPSPSSNRYAHMRTR
jgi:hypothetical protein